MEMRLPRFLDPRNFDPSVLDPRNIYRNPRRVLDPRTFRGGAVADIAIEMTPGLRDRDKGFLQGLVTTPGPAPIKLLSALILGDLRTGLGDETRFTGQLFDDKGNLTNDAQRARVNAVASGKEDMFPQFDASGMRTRMTYGPTKEEFNTSNLPEQKTAPLEPQMGVEQTTYVVPTGQDPARVEVTPGGGNVSPEVETKQEPQMMSMDEVLRGSTEGIKQ